VDWLAFASVVSSATVATATIAVNALSKRGDRKHASELDFEKRSWDLKSAALLELVGVCVEIDRGVDKSDALPTLRVDELLRVDRALVKARGSVGATASALAHERTAVAMEALIAYFDDSLGDARADLVRATLYGDLKESAVDEADFTRAAEFRDLERQALSSVELAPETESVRRIELRDRVKALRDLAQKDVKGQL
jgi:hypothetical protein